jgi:hypothetical protein
MAIFNRHKKNLETLQAQPQPRHWSVFYAEVEFSILCIAIKIIVYYFVRYSNRIFMKVLLIVLHFC